MTESMVRRGHWLASPDALDLFGDLGPTLASDEPTALAVLGANGSPGSTQLTRELAAVTAAETGEPVLRVRPTAGLDTAWSLCAVPDATAPPRLAAILSPADEGTVQDLRAALSDARAQLPPLSSEIGGHALLRVPIDTEDAQGGVPTERLPAAAKGPFRTVFLELSHEDTHLARYTDGVIVVVPPDASVSEATDLERRVEDSGGSIVSVLIGSAAERADDTVERYASEETAYHETSAPAPTSLALGRSLTRLAGLGLLYVVCMAGASSLLRPPLPPGADETSSPPDTVLVSRGLPLSAGALRPRPLAPRAGNRAFSPPPSDATPADGVAPPAPPPPLEASPTGIVSAPLVRATAGLGPGPWRPVPPDEALGLTASLVPDAGVDGVTRPVRLADDADRPSYATVPGLGPVDATVLLSAVIRADGSVGDVELIEVTGTPADIVEPAIRTVKQWRYRPATRDGRDVDSRITVLIDFRDGA